MKILLVDPPFYRFIGYYNRYFPFGLAYIAAVLREEGHEVLIYDADYNENPSKMDFTRLEDWTDSRNLDSWLRQDLGGKMGSYGEQKTKKKTYQPV